MITPNLRDLKLEMLPHIDKGSPASRSSSTLSISPPMDVTHKFSNPVNLISRKSSIKSISNASLSTLKETKNTHVDTKQHDFSSSSSSSSSGVQFGRVDNVSRKPGLSYLPSQSAKISTLHGGTLTILLVGERGTGKTSFINSLFETRLINEESIGGGDNESISIHRFELVENNIRLDLRVIETIDYGNSFKKNTSWTRLSKYVDDQFKSYLYQSQQPKRATLVDSRIHCCIYFLNPVIKLISNLDIQSMKSLSTKTNLLPVIAKADMLTDIELNNFKKLVTKTLREYRIRICEHFSTPGLLQKIEVMVPFVIVSSLDKYEDKNGKLVRARKYPWGTVEVENVLHCDFVYIRKFLLVENTLEFVASTDIYYEQFRCAYLTSHMTNTAKYETTNKILNGLEQLMIQQQDQIVELVGNKKCSDTERIGLMEQQVNYRISKYRKEQESRLRSWKVHLVDEQEKLQKELHLLANQRNQLQKAIDEFHKAIEVDELETSSGTFKNGTDENNKSITPSIVSKIEDVSPQIS